MLWALLTRPLSVLATVAGVALLAPVLLPLAGVLLKPLVKPATKLYLDIAEEMGEVIEEREKLQAAAAEEKAIRRRLKGEEAKVAAGTALLDEVSRIL